jgi:acyl-CoA synthetase (AMP-forming)/AMP-acid ligase II
MNTTFTLVPATLRLRAHQKPHEKAFTYLLDGSDDEVSLTYAELDRQARAIASRLQAEGMAGQRVLLLYVPGLEFIAALYGCLYAGAIAVPAYAPDPSRLARTLPRLQAIVQDCDVKLVLTTSPLLSMADALLAHAPDLAAKRWAASDALAGGDGAAWVEPAAGANDVALLQYTSGSTAAPKGVVVSHRAALANLHMIGQAYRLDEQTCLSMWVPFYHDMGLIGGILLTPFLGGSIVFMSPMEFIRRPLRWLQTFRAHRATMSWITNFALDLCARKISPEERSGLDLSSWRTVVVGAEPVRHASLRRFVQTFEPVGFRPESLFPSYGLAEAVLLVSGGRVEDLYRVGWFCREALEQGRVVPCEATTKTAQPVVSCGRPVPGQRIEIVHPDTGARCPSGHIGEIWVAGPNVAQGYWKQPEELATMFQARLAEAGEETFLRTGDLGFMQGGELYVAGRLKDLIILRGRNVYPQDIEFTVEQCHPRVRPSCAAAFPIETAEGEALVIVAEVATQDLGEDPGRRQRVLEEVITVIVEAVSEAHEVEVFAVALIQARSLPKTSSGKIQRKATRAGLLQGKLPIEKRWDARQGSPAKSYVAPRTPTEEALSDLWKEVLGLHRVGVHDNFFVLGGQSLLAAEVAERLRPLFGVELSARTLFEAKTIADLAKIIEGLRDPSGMEEIAL